MNSTSSAGFMEDGSTLNLKRKKSNKVRKQCLKQKIDEKCAN